MTIATPHARRRRVWTLLLAPACTALLLAACGSRGASPTAPASPTPDATAAAAATTIAQALASVAGGTATDAPTEMPTVAPTEAPTVAPTAMPAPRIDLGVLTRTLVGEIALRGTGEPGATVFVYLDGAIAATAPAGAGGAWAVLLAPVEPGPHVLTAAASDAADAAQSAPVRVVVQARATNTPTLTDTPVPTNTPTSSPTLTFTPTPHPTATQTRSPTQTPSRAPTPRATATPTPNHLSTSVAATITADAALRTTATVVALTATVDRDMVLPTSTPISRAGGSNVWTEPASGITFVHVPAGEFLMGSTETQANSALETCHAISSSGCERGLFVAETPQHSVFLDDYWIGQTEVTNAQFRAFVESGGYMDRSLWTDAGWWWREENAVTKPGCWEDSNANQARQPVVCVSWYEAMAYTRWLARESGMAIWLPTEAEWEKAARADGEHVFPWGNESIDGTRANFCDVNCGYDWANVGVNDGYGLAAPVGSYAASANLYGALDMAGNVWEWTSSLYMPYTYSRTDGREDVAGVGARTVRSGSFNDRDVVLRCAFRYFSNPDNRIANFGFRVASSGL